VSTRSSSEDPIVERLLRAMAPRELDAIAAMSPENVTYVSGAEIPSQALVRSRLAAAIVPREARTAVVAVGLEGDLVRERSRLDEVITYEEFVQDPIEVIARSLADRGLAGGRIGIETAYLSARDYERLAGLLPAATLEPVDELFEDLRMVKTPGEIEALRSIGVVAERIVKEACAAVRPGDTERKLGNIIAELYGEGGGDRLTMLVVAAGERSAHPNGPPTSRVMSEGDLVRLDVIGTAGGYYSDVGRTAVVGEPSERQQEIYDLLRDVHGRTLAALRPGALSSDIYRIYQDAMAQAELPAYHFVGHGLGITLHEEPFLDPHGSRALEEGMVMCVEPLTFVSGEFGIQIEDEVVITADGCEPLTVVGGLLRITG
jgi:Xaa-Pro aminopeptidase